MNPNPTVNLIEQNFFFNQKVKQKKVSYSMALKFLQP